MLGNFKEWEPQELDQWTKLAQVKIPKPKTTSKSTGDIWVSYSKEQHQCNLQ